MKKKLKKLHPFGSCFKCGRLVKWRTLHRHADGHHKYVYNCFDHRVVTKHPKEKDDA